MFQNEFKLLLLFLGSILGDIFLKKTTYGLRLEVLLV